MSHNRPVLRLFFINWGLGILLGSIFAAAMLSFNIGGIGTLVSKSEVGYIAVIMLFVGFSVTWGAVVCASAVMRVSRDDSLPPSGLGEIARAVPVKVSARQH